MAPLLRMSRAQLDAMFAGAPPGRIPDGSARGIALILTSTSLANPIAQFVRICAWQGKTFDASRGRLTNQISPFGLNAIRADVYEGASWHDGRPCIVLDYSKASLVARPIRDEMRLIDSGLYLGKVYVMRQPVFGFALQF
jgi:hypothetical protein